jgi:NADH dehydrogenase (ubiquinone) 1 alpha subcomplex subunit 5
LEILLKIRSTDNPRIADLEQQYGSGLLEEVIQVAEGENKLVDVMIENRV